MGRKPIYVPHNVDSGAAVSIPELMGRLEGGGSFVDVKNSS